MSSQRVRTRPPVASVSFEARAFPLAFPFAITGSRQEEAACVFVRVTDEEGNEGWGEASPLPVVTGDSVPSALAFLSAHGPELVGLDVDAAAHTVHARLRPAHHAHATSALCALEAACLDLKARRLGVPLRSVLHTGVLEHVETDITVPALSVDELAAFWPHFEHHGFRVHKVKVTGASRDDDLQRAMEAAARLPTGGSLVLDGNQGFDVDGALALVDDLGERGVAVRFFEQPLPRDDARGLRALMDRCPVPVCLDESVRSVVELTQHLALSRRFLVNLKIMKSGVQECLAMGLVARAHGVGLMIGGMMETDLAMACSLQLCAALGGVDVCDLDTPFYLREQACNGSPWSEASAFLRVPTGAGVGLRPRSFGGQDIETIGIFPPSLTSRGQTGFQVD